MARKLGRKKKRRRSRDRRAWLLGSLVVGVVLLALIFEWKSSRLFMKKERVNLLFIGRNQGAEIMSIDFVTKKINWLDFPKESLIPARSLGYYQVGKLVDLAKYEKKPMGFILSRFQRFVKLPLNAYCLVTDKVNLNEKTGAYLGWHCQQTNLNLIDKLILSYIDREYVSDRWDLGKWQQWGVVEKQTDEGLSYDALRLNGVIKQKLFDWAVAQEGLTVAIVDESGVGLAQDLDALIENLGAHVVVNKQGTKIRTKTQILVSEAKLEKSLTVKQIEALVHSRKIKVGSTDDYRADVVIVVGRDLNQWVF